MNKLSTNIVSYTLNGATIYEDDQKTPLTSIVDTEDVYVEGWGFFKVNAQKIMIENPVVGATIEWCPVRKCYAAVCFLDLRRIAMCEF